MPCLIALVALLFPRLIIAILAIFTTYLGSAYSSPLWPILGFFLAPYTTLAYAWAKNINGSVDGMYLVIVIIAVLLDLGAMGGGATTRRKRSF
jgi:hypothetical protein